jgi:hypothetical protein
MNKQTILHYCVLQWSYLITLLVATLMTFFLKFHLYLLNSNKTTIENLDKKGSPY